MGVRELPEETGLPHSRLTDDRHDLAASYAALLDRRVELLDLARTTDELGETSARRHLKTRPRRSGAKQLVDVDRLPAAPHVHRTQRRDLYVALREPQRCHGDEHRRRRRGLLDASSQMRRLSNRRVVDMQVARDGADDDFPGVQTDANLREDAFLTAHALAVPLDGLLHSQRRVARADGMVLVGERRAEERHDSVPHHPVDGALVVMHRLHHLFEDRIEDPAGLFRIAVGEEFHGALEIGEQYGHLLALAFKRGLGREDLLGEVPGSIGLGSSEARRRGLVERCCTLPAELVF
jgi:hypothetical protein